jgi:hypothetical protein
MSRIRSLRMSMKVSTEESGIETSATPLSSTPPERPEKLCDSAVSPFLIVTKPSVEASPSSDHSAAAGRA